MGFQLSSSAYLFTEEANSKFGISFPVSWNNADIGKQWLHSSHSWINKTCPIKCTMGKNFPWSSRMNFHYIKENVGGKMGWPSVKEMNKFQEGKLGLPLVNSLIIRLLAHALGFPQETKAMQRHFVTRTSFHVYLSNATAGSERQS